MIEDRLKEFRAKIGLTQEQLALKMGLKKSTYATYEGGGSKPTDKVYESLFENFGLSITWLVTGHGEMFELSKTEAENLREELKNSSSRTIDVLVQLMDEGDEVLEERIEGLEQRHVKEIESLRQELEHTQERLEAKADKKDVERENHVLRRELEKLRSYVYEQLPPDGEEPEEAEQEAKAKLPYYGLVAAAGPLRDLDTVEQTILIPESLLPQNREGLFVGRIEGDSMADIIPDEAEILLRVCSEPVSGRVYVFSLRGQATIKKFHIDHTGPHFEYMNGSGKTIYPEPGEQWYCNAEFLRAL